VRRTIFVAAQENVLWWGRQPGRDSFHDGKPKEAPVQHFNMQNLHQIRDAGPRAWATVLANDFETFSELSRCGFHLVDMSGGIWTMRRAG
jgi:hypothetical protein